MNLASLRSYSFWVPALLFFLHLMSERVFNLSLSWVDSYIDPLCLGPLVLHLMSIERRLLFDQQMGLLDVTVVWVVLLVVAELLFPMLSDHFVADLYDLIAITVGCLVFVFSQWDLLKSETKRDADVSGKTG